MNQTRITTLVLTASLTLAGLIAQAEEATAPAKTPPPHREGRRPEFLDRIEKELNLTDAQKEQVKPILKDARQQAQGLQQDTTLTPDQKREKFRAIHQEVVDKLKGILTPEQLEKLHKIREEMRERIHQRHGKRGASAETK